MSPLGAPADVLDAESGYLTDAAGTSMLSTSQFLITAHGSNWLIQMKSDPTKCVDANAAANATTVHVNACSGVASQDWMFTPQPTRDGAFLIQTAATGNRCLHVKNGSTSANAGMEVYDCSPTSSFQRFNVQAIGTQLALATSASRERPVPKGIGRFAFWRPTSSARRRAPPAPRPARLVGSTSAVSWRP